MVEITGQPGNYSQLTNVNIQENLIIQGNLRLDGTSNTLKLNVLTTAQRDALVDPELGDMIFNSDADHPEYYNGTDWDSGVAGGDVIGPSGNAADGEFALFDGTTGEIIKSNTTLLIKSVGDSALDISPFAAGIDFTILEAENSVGNNYFVWQILDDVAPAITLTGFGTDLEFQTAGSGSFSGGDIKFVSNKAIEFTATDSLLITDLASLGAAYAADYSSGAPDRWLTDKAYVDGIAINGSADTQIIYNDNDVLVGDAFFIRNGLAEVVQQQPDNTTSIFWVAKNSGGSTRLDLGLEQTGDSDPLAILNSTDGVIFKTLTVDTPSFMMENLAGDQSGMHVTDGTPVSTLTPKATGFLAVDVTNQDLYIAQGATSADWEVFATEEFVTDATVGASTDTQVIFNNSDVLTGDDSNTWDNTNHVLSIGNLGTGAVGVRGTVAVPRAGTTPTGASFPEADAAFHAKGINGVEADIYLDSRSDTASNAANFNMRRARDESAGLVADGDILGTWLMQGHDGTAFREAAYIRAQVDGVAASNDMPGRLIFATTPDGSSGALERMRIQEDGFVGIGTMSPDTELQIIGTGKFDEIQLEGASNTEVIFRNTSGLLDGDDNFTWDSPNDILSLGQVGTGNDATLLVIRDGDQPGFPNAAAAIEVRGTDAHQADLLMDHQSDNSGGASKLIFQRTRVTGDNVANNETLGIIRWTGYFDGYARAAQIHAAVDGAPSNEDMPGRLLFSTSPDGTSAPLTRVVIRSTGNVAIGDGSQNTESLLQVEGSFAVRRLVSAGSPSTDDEVIIGITDTSSVRTVTILEDDIQPGRLFIIKDESGGAGTNNITVITDGAGTFDGQASVSITADYGVLRLYAAGTNLFAW